MRSSQKLDSRSLKDCLLRSRMFRFSRAICRKIPRSIVSSGLRLHEPKDPINYELAVSQHEQYVDALRHAGVEQITVLASDENLPDCVFVEDTALIIGNEALITNPGADSRKAEIASIRSILENEGKLSITVMKSPSSLDGGDVLYTGREIFVGLTSRTNELGIDEIRKTFPALPVHVIKIPRGTLHLKSLMSMAMDDCIVFGESSNAKQAMDLVLQKARHAYKVITVPDDCAANCVLVNGTLLHRSWKEFPDSIATLDRLPLPKVALNGSELAKVDGALTCCSLLY